MDELPQPNSTTQQVKESFEDLCVIHNFHFHALKALAETAHVERSVVNKMYLGTSVRRAEAERVLEAFSSATGETCNLDTVEVALLPTLADLHKEHRFNLASLATGAGVPYPTVNMMMNGQKVTKQDAYQILKMASHQMHVPLTLENVDVALFDEEVHHE